MDELSLVEPLLDTDRKTMFLDVFSGANAPLAKAFLQCQWEIVTPINIEIDHTSRLRVQSYIGLGLWYGLDHLYFRDLVYSAQR